MKNFIKTGLLVIVLAVFLAPASAFAKEEVFVPVLDSASVDDFVDILNKFASQSNISMKGKKHTTTQDGYKVCEVEFGNNSLNKISVFPGDNGEINGAWVVFSSEGDNAEQGLMMAFMTLRAVGLNDSEYEKFTKMFQNDVNNATQSPFEKKYNIYCSATKRTINIDVYIDETQSIFDIGASK